MLLYSNGTIRRKFILVFMVIFVVAFASAQNPVNNPIFTSEDSNNVSFFYENDVFVGQDYGNTQSIYINWQSQSLAKKLLLFKGNEKLIESVNISFEHRVFTPKDLSDNAVITNDYPYAASLSIAIQNAWVNPFKNQHIRASLNLGILGPAAGGKQMQSTIHTATGDQIPQGWDNQISNNPIVNLQIAYQRKVKSLSDVFAVILHSDANIGTFYNAINAATTLKLGYVANKKYKKLHFISFAQPNFTYVFHDATLQGSVFNESPHTIENNIFRPFNFSITWGVSFRYKNLLLSYHTQSSSERFINNDHSSRTFKNNSGISMVLTY